MKKVLILDGDSAHAVAIMECLHKSGYLTSVLCTTKLSYGYYSKYVSEHYIGPDSHSDKYLDFVISLLKKHKFDVLIPTSDETAKFMSKNKAELSHYAGVLMPNYDVFMAAYDKNQLMSLCQAKGYPHPHTVDLKLTNGVIPSTFPFPALIKPNLTTGARGMTLVHNSDEFYKAYPAIHAEYGECHLQQFIPAGGRQIKVQIFTDKQCQTLYSSVIWKQRYYPVNGGSSCCNETIEDPKIVDICGRVLKDIGWVGFADFDLIENPLTKELLIMEINPRIPASVRSVFKSGIDYATMIADATIDAPIKKYKYIPGKRLRHLGFDVLWFMNSKNRFNTKPSWFNFFGRDLYYQDWVKGNFISFIAGSIGNIKKQLNPEFRKAKAGCNDIQ